MFNTFICGSFKSQEDDDIDSFCSTPKRSPKRSKRNGSYKTKEIKNPYADRGLDKFNALLAELEDTKQKIYTEKGAEDISVVQFVYSNDNQIKPIVVKVKEKNPHEFDNQMKKSEAMEMEFAEDGNGVQKSSLEIEKRLKRKRSNLDFFKLENFRKPSYYLPMILILILMLLAIFGKSFAILCTSIGWYVIPTKKGGSSNSRRTKRKKEYSRRLSEKNALNDGSSSPTSVINGPVDTSPEKHGHKRSW